jgi:hypothetical protein
MYKSTIEHSIPRTVATLYGTITIEEYLEKYVWKWIRLAYRDDPLGPYKYLAVSRQYILYLDYELTEDDIY